MSARSTPFETPTPMNPATVQFLLGLNRQFYDEFSGSFAESRGLGQPGLRRALDFLPAAGHVLDVGCGNGRLAHELDTAGRRIDYLGIDSSASLLEIARRQAAHLRSVHAEFLSIDVTLPGWASLLPVRQVEAIAMLAVLHHLPGWQLRCAVLATLRGLLDPEGTLLVSAWQFVNEDRLQRKIVPWSAVGLSEQELESGDALLDWQRGGRGLRYCHYIDEAELVALAQKAGLAVSDLFYADGRSHKLNLFAALRVAR